MNKLKTLKALVQASDSYRWAKTALFVLLAFKALEFAFGTALVLLVFVAGFAVAPLYAKRFKEDQRMDDRNKALTSIKNLLEQATRHRSWSVRGMPEDEAKAIRFAFAQKVACDVHRKLELRAKHLDRCASENLPVHTGADWDALATVADKVADMLDSAQWICSNNMAPNPGLLDPNWELSVVIHSESKLEDEAVIEAEEVSQRVVVEMGDYSSLRKHRTRPYGKAELFVLGEDKKSNDSR